jgi:hypothetical protein
MINTPSAADEDREHTMASLARSRARLRELLDPGEESAPMPERFPRSRTMRLLASRQGARTAAALGAGLLLTRPAIGLRLLRMVPMGAIARILLSRLFTASGAKS